MAKIQGAELEALRQAVVPLDTPARRHAYVVGDFTRSDRVKDLNERYRWDLFWAAGVRVSSDTDTHIDTALRSIVPKLEDN